MQKVRQCLFCCQDHEDAGGNWLGRIRNKM